MLLVVCGTEIVMLYLLSHRLLTNNFTPAQWLHTRLDSRAHKKAR